VCRRRLTVVLFSLVLVVVGVAVFTNVIPFGQIRDQQRQVVEAAARLEALEQENEILTAQRDALQTPVEIERLAREKLGYVRPGEVAYVVLEPPTTPTVTDSQSEAAEEEEPLEDESLWDTVWEFVTGADLQQ
jgi:cell division protein FtsB